MNVRCGINGETLSEINLFVCHHCGMPVCGDHGWVVTADDAFADSASAPTRLPESSTQVSPTLLAYLPAPIAARLRRPAKKSTAVPRSAMHCRDCADRHHKGADRRHGWFHSPPAGRS